MLNKAIIPLYINSSILNNLYTTVIQEFAEVKSISKKEVLSVHYRAPVSEFSYDIFGKYAQGDLEIGFQNEFVKQKTEENISTIVVLLKELRDMLIEKQLLKRIESSENIQNVIEGEYVEFSTALQANPKISSIRSIIDNYEVEKIFEIGLNNNVYVQDSMITFMEGIKDMLEKCSISKCHRYISFFSKDSNSVAITPLKKSCMIEEDYLCCSNVTVLGKVVRVHRCKKIREDIEALNNLKREFDSKTILDKINVEEITIRLEERFEGIKSKIYNAEFNLNNLDNIIEVIPISIVI
jgi:molybdopterin converting factor small subunit